MQGNRRPRVAIVYKSLPQYRRRFFELLRQRLDQLGVELVLVYGQAGAKDAAKKDTVNLPWAHRIENTIVRVAGRELYWQPCLGLVRGAELVIAEQASKLLVNYLLQLFNLLGVQRFAFWGHGKNFQAHEGSRLGEWLKRLVSSKVHWWFTYNEISSRVVRELGFPQQRITSVQNAIDTRALIAARRRLEPEQLEALKRELGVTGDNVCIFSSSMYREKRLGFLIEACLLIRAQVPDFQMIFIGAGPEDHLVSEAAQKYPWLHYLGPRFDAAKVPYFALSKLLLMPGLVGLGVLDAFALEVPLVTTDLPYHSPEIEYLNDSVNGVIVAQSQDAAAYAAAVVELLRDDLLRDGLVQGCREAAARYTVEEMVERFAAGVLRALEQK